VKQAINKTLKISHQTKFYLKQELSIQSMVLALDNKTLSYFRNNRKKKWL